jgi:acyl transferase domain-containing protein
MGHTEGGSGITGLIKSVLALEHGIIPPNLNFTTPNPQSTPPRAAIDSLILRS